MNVLIDNKDLKSVYGISVLDYTGALAFPAERVDERTWQDKSGVDKNTENIRYDTKEFLLTCYCKASNEVLAYDLINTLVEYMFAKGVFVLSLRDTVQGTRKAFLCSRSTTIVPEINVRQQNSLYVFKLGLKDVNPNALKYYNTITGLSTSIAYDKGQSASIYWGDGDKGVVSNSGNYSKVYLVNEVVDIIVDIDKNTPVVTMLTALFSATPTGSALPLAVQFTDLSSGTIALWSWDFGDGFTSSEQNPLHIYTTVGTFTVTLQVFNAVGGVASHTKTNYINTRKSRLLVNNNSILLINNEDNLLKH